MWLLCLTFAADTPATDPLIGWLQTAGTVGLLAFAVVAFLREWIVPGPSSRRELTAERAKTQQLETELRETRVFIRDELVPLITRSTDVLGKVLEEQAWQDRRRRET